ncbi:unnamed protein product, partial [Musa textilis]
VSINVYLNQFIHILILILFSLMTKQSFVMTFSCPDNFPTKRKEGNGCTMLHQVAQLFRRFSALKHKHPQLQKDEDLAHRKQHPCTVP